MMNGGKFKPSYLIYRRRFNGVQHTWMFTVHDEASLSALVCVTRWGMVHVAASEDDATLRMVIDGQECQRVFRREMTKAGLERAAHAMAHDMHQGAKGVSA